ncbi:hypothetical protein GCM10007879_06450 [Maritalea porphyrae]|uniref:Diguanylate cyclase n=2 Tax=Maritalea porphyrae TaxID=880732 RepID=A0ABQ5UMY0_9HYPH|nr:hypothetical protein GCM10007879_06450 [Maritalea porphyrae]
MLRHMQSRELSIVDPIDLIPNADALGRAKGIFLITTDGQIASVFGDLAVLLNNSETSLVGQDIRDILRAAELDALFAGGSTNQNPPHKIAFLAESTSKKIEPQRFVLTVHLPEQALQTAPQMLVEIHELVETAVPTKTANKHDDRIRFALQSAAQAVWDCDMNSGEIWYSSRWYTMRGFEIGDSQASGAENWQKRLHPDDRDEILEQVHAQDSGELTENSFEYRERHADGNWIWIMSRGRIIAWNSDGTPARIVGTDTDITDMKMRERQLTLETRRFFEKSMSDIAAAHQRVVEDSEKAKQLANQDPLTGLANRRALLEKIESWVAKDHEEPGVGRLLFFLDLDNFKPINDSLGHVAGDFILRETAHRLAQITNSSDMIARLGGDEFAILIERGLIDEDVSDIAYRICTRIIDAITTPIEYGGRSLQLGVSIGVTDFERANKSADQLLHAADVAMYNAKNRGGNRFSLADS